MESDTLQDSLDKNGENMRGKILLVSAVTVWLCTFLITSINVFTDESNLLLTILLFVCALLLSLGYLSERKKTS